MMKNKWISIKSFKVHEFRTTLRRMHRDENTWARRFEILSELEERAQRYFIKLCSLAILSYLIVTSLRSNELLKLKIQSFEVSVPITYFLTASSFLFMFVIISFCHLSVVMSLKAAESGKVILPGFSTSIYGLLQGKGDDVSLGIPAFLNSFIKERFPVSNFLSSAILLGILAALIPMAALGVYLFNEQVSLLHTDVSLVEKVSVLCGALLTCTSAIYLLLFHTPLPTKKNTRQIRWNFLVYLTSDRHPREDYWLKEEKTDNS